MLATIVNCFNISNTPTITINYYLVMVIFVVFDK
ncbi:unknown [Prevotella sp. CAG:1031]|nr:unknown [Prevotella sp. CAG:1031]